MSIWTPSFQGLASDAGTQERPHITIGQNRDGNTCYTARRTSWKLAVTAHGTLDPSLPVRRPAARPHVPRPRLPSRRQIQAPVMAIDRVFPTPPPRNLVRDSDKIFFPLSIPISHWQLRHFISVPAASSAREADDHVVYYASKADVYCLNTKSRKRKRVAHLPFDARCTASGYGWVLVGGDDRGRFAALKVDVSDASAEVDARIDGLITMTGETRSRTPHITINNSGDDIVNSISIHRLQCPTAHLEDTVAVLTNNDKTVRVFSLSLGRETCLKQFPFFMNHATISPCGTMMVAVGDEPQAFFFRREMLEDPPPIPKPHNRLNSCSLDWKLVQTVDLHVTPGTVLVAGQPTSHPKGYFTTAWSPNSKLCAVGSEGGYITVFDTDLLPEVDAVDERVMNPIVALVPGSRPDIPVPHAGAIRSMMFSPQPWDLLFWTEDQGRICVGDLRTGLQTRQVVELESKGFGQRSWYIDVADENVAEVAPLSPDRQLADDMIESISGTRPSRTTRESTEDDLLRFNDIGAGGANFAHQYMEAHRRINARRRAQQRETTSTAVSPRMPTFEGFSPREQQLLDTIRTTRQREEARAQANGNGGGVVPNVNYTSAEMFRSSSQNGSEGTTTSNPSASSLAESARVLRHARNIQALGSSTSSLATRMAALNQYMQERSNGEDMDDHNDEEHNSHEGEEDDDEAWRPIERLYAQQRRLHAANAAAHASASVSPAPVNDTASSSGSSTTTSSNSTNRHVHSRNPSSTASTALPSLSDMTRVRLPRPDYVNLAERNDRTTTTNAGSSSSSNGGYPPPPTYTAYESSFLRRQLLMHPRARQIGEMSSVFGSRRHELGPRTTGLALTPGGEMLFAACEDGIWEIPVELKGRMYCDAVDLR